MTPSPRSLAMPTEADSADSADMQALQAGEDLALNRLMERHRDKVFRYLIRFLQNEDEALDLAQETFVRVYTYRNKFKTNHRFASWMYTIATNLARDRMKWLSRHQYFSLDAAAPEGQVPLLDRLPEDKPAPNERLEQDERVAQIKRILAQIPEDLRTPLVLMEYEGLSQGEIAEILNCNAKAVENRLYRARKLLREKLRHLLEPA